MQLVGSLVVTVVGGWLGGYYGSYASQKGKNLATHEDIDKLVDQVRAVTFEQEQIKSAISGDLWNRQAAWTMKREAYVELLSAASAVELALGHDAMVEESFRTGAMKLDDPRVSHYENLLAETTARLHRAVAVGRLVFDAEAVARIDEAKLEGVGIKGANSIYRLRTVVAQEGKRELGLAPIFESK